MALDRLDISQFRNHRSVALQTRHPFVILHGPNGAGKTNILEAVSLLVPGRGLRRAAFQEMALRGGDGSFAISAELDGNRIGTAVEAANPNRRIVHINGATASAASLAEWLAVLWVTPAMDRIFVEGATGRRRFLDRLVLALDPGHAVASARYEKGLRQRNRMIAEGQGDNQWFDAVEMQLAEAGSLVAQARSETVTRLHAAISAMPDLPFARPELNLECDTPHDAATLAECYREFRQRDRAAGRTLVGPHRADLVAHHAGHGGAAGQCSTGEQKAMLLSLIIAHANLVGELRTAPPVLLLDEVAAHLDPDRRAALFEALRATGSQVWMTGTEPELFDSIKADALRLHVADGNIAG
ncbi:DNA replication/repair protein RecF [Sphingorhabdus sp.]|jgi:DNA replication and repair protein RecF|uniref:DNA replication/repair protein RecF n=1 Tax=Sphingorhabdus sp. TaxID=1902408 RepID=UPI003BB19641|nr:DNA replication/repair protein RecF [Sphingomonadales bacterium]MBL0021146.1 DNA replication/repair protein RecF [Sphingomonadales bacterium]